MGALMDENPPYRLEYTVATTRSRREEVLSRDEMRRDVRGWIARMDAGAITDVKVTNRHGEDVTVDWFG